MQAMSSFKPLTPKASVICRKRNPSSKPNEITVILVATLAYFALQVIRGKLHGSFEAQ